MVVTDALNTHHYIPININKEKNLNIRVFAKPLSDDLLDNLY